MFQNLKNELGEDDFKKLILQTDSDGYTGRKKYHKVRHSKFLALHRASNSGSYDLAVGLIKNGADVNAKTDDGWIPLHSGTVFSYFYMFIFLILYYI